MTNLTEEELINWLRLIRSDNVGPRTFKALLSQFGTAGRALEALPELAKRGGRLLIRIASRKDAEAELLRARKSGIRFIAWSDSDYPEPLRVIDSAPPLLAVKGNVALLSRPVIGIVGSRNASAAGLSMTERLARDLGQQGYAVVSGLARGVDTRAHQASLQTGTIAVLAGGHERIYPSQNVPLLEKILECGGAAVTEMPIEWEPRAQDFPRRNRIVSGLSYGVVVVEAAKRSGSLITARLALEQGREVFAVPGSPLDPRAEGPNDLIRQGATLCGKAEHVMEVIEPLLPAGTKPQGQTGFLPFSEESRIERNEAVSIRQPLPANDETARVSDLLGPTPVIVDDLIRMADLPLRVVQIALLELEIAGRLERHAGNRVSLHS